MRSNYILKLIIVFLFVAISAKGQDPMGLYFMQTIPQSSLTNPALQPRANWYIQLASVNQYFQSDLAFKDAFQDQGNGEWVDMLSSRFDYNKFYKATGKAANFNHYLDIGALGFGFRSGSDYFTFSLSVKNVLQTGLPSHLFKIPEKGMPAGETFDFSTYRIKEMAYKEFSIGYSREWNDELTVGVNVKPLFGIATAVTDFNTFKLNTSLKQWDLIVKGNVHASAPLDVTEGEPGDFPKEVEYIKMEKEEYIDYLTSFSNPGLALDFGVAYKLTDDITLSAAISNLGFISWNRDMHSIAFDGTYSFEGVEVNGFKDNDDLFSDIADSIKTIIDFDYNNKKFATRLTPSLHLAGTYHLNNSISLGLLSRSVFQSHNLRQEFNVSANVQPYSFIAFNVNYSYRVNGANGLGTGFSILNGPLQFYFLMDYLPTHYTNVDFDGEDIFMLPNQKDLSFKFGINLIFGRHGYRDTPMISLK
jgi:hypothetical protein